MNERLKEVANVNINKRSKDKWFYYKLLAGLFTLTVVAWIYISHMVQKKWVGINLSSTDIPFSYIGFQSQFLSFFTIQSNIIVGFWFIYAAIYHHKLNKFWLKQNTIIAVTSYISVTFLTYMLLIFPSRFNQMDPITYFESMSQHLIVPLLMIFYTLFHFQHHMINMKEYIRKHLGKTLIYPGIYFLLILYRLILWSLDGYDPGVSFPYLPPLFLVSPGQNPTITMIIMIGFLLLFVLINMVLFVGTNLFYVWFANKINHKYFQNLHKNSPNNPQI